MPSFFPGPNPTSSIEGVRKAVQQVVVAVKKMAAVSKDPKVCEAEITTSQLNQNINNILTSPNNIAGNTEKKSAQDQDYSENNNTGFKL